MKKQRINIGLVCTTGGHFEQAINLSEFYKRYNHFWITHDNTQTQNQLKNQRKYFISCAHFKNPFTYLYHIPFIIKIFSNEKPTHILSTGSGRTALIPFLLSKIMRIDFLYIDTFSHVRGYSKFGTFLKKINHSFFTQWADHENKNITYIGPVFEKTNEAVKDDKSNYIFVTLGTRPEAFTRLLQSVETLVKSKIISEKVIVQAGHTKYKSNHLILFDFCPPDKIDELIKNARYVITQESAGIGTKCLKYKTKFLVMPRKYQYGELPAKSDMNEDLHFKLEEMGYTKVVDDVNELQRAIKELDNLETGFSFNNHLAITTLTKSVEGV